MKVKIPVITTEGWKIESYKIFDNCLYCGWCRQLYKNATYIINGKKKIGQAVKCKCYDMTPEIEIVMEEMLIIDLEQRGIVLLENY